MMTTLQLGSRLMRYLKGVQTLGDLPAPETAGLVDAINFGLGEFCSLLPDWRLTTPMGWLLRAPVVQSIDIVAGAAGFSYVAGSPFPAGGYPTEGDAIGHTVIVTGDPKPNLLNRAGELLVPYAGGSGNTNMTIYGDAVNLGENDQSVISEMNLVLPEGTTKQLDYIDAPDAGIPFQVGYASQDIRYGQPESWYVTSHLGNERTSSPLWLVHVWPLPTSDYTLRAQMRAFPASLKFDDLHVARNLPLKVEEESLLIAMIAPGLRTSAFLADHIDKNDLDFGAARARIRLEEMQHPLTTQPAMCGTPRGF